MTSFPASANARTACNPVRMEMSCSGEGLPKQTAGRVMFFYETVDGGEFDVTLCSMRVVELCEVIGKVVLVQDSVS